MIALLSFELTRDCRIGSISIGFVEYNNSITYQLFERIWFEDQRLYAFG